MEKLGQEYRCRTSPVQCHVPISFRDRRMNRLNTTLLTSAPLVAQIHAHRQTVQIGAKLTSLILFSARCCHLFRIQLSFSLTTSSASTSFVSRRTGPGDFVRFDVGSLFFP